MNKQVYLKNENGIQLLKQKEKLRETFDKMKTYQLLFHLSTSYMHTLFSQSP